MTGQGHRAAKGHPVAKGKAGSGRKGAAGGRRAAGLAVAAVIVGGVLFGAALALVHREDIRSWLQKTVKAETVTYNARPLKYRRVFNDMQDKHIKAAMQFGLMLPPESREVVEEMKKELEQIGTCKEYYVQNLTQSVPYLRPRSARELKAIGRAFQDSLEAKGLPQYRIVVTSVLRTQKDVGRLRRTNGNATKNSAHCYGTTFDISYVTFDRRAVSRQMASEDLRKVLGEVLRDRRDSGRIWVKYEGKQTCFHITCRE